jgi:ABC-type phosphate/phosphonate transport system substrate-binding protein
MILEQTRTSEHMREPREGELVSGYSAQPHRMRLASLPWYALDEVRPALDALWARIARRLDAAGLAGVPAQLDYDPDYEAQWNSGRLLVGQACGYDAVFGYSKQLRIVATPRFDFPGCVGANYRSFIAVRDASPARDIADLRDLRCVINTPTSHSGMNILRALVAPLHERGRFFSRVTVSGSHEFSLRALQANTADVASIDCITWGLLQTHRPSALHGLRILHRTEAIPAPPFVTAAATRDDEVETIRAAFADELRNPDGEPHRSLGLLGVQRLEDSAYESVAHYADEARRWGYDLLRQATG